MLHQFNNSLQMSGIPDPIELWPCAETCLFGVWEQLCSWVETKKARYTAFRHHEIVFEYYRACFRSQIVYRRPNRHTIYNDVLHPVLDRYPQSITIAASSHSVAGSFFYIRPLTEQVI